jgi:hypothetical protein
MPSKNPAQRLRDILDNIDLIGEFTRGLIYERLCRRYQNRLRCCPRIVDRLGGDAGIASRTEGAKPETGCEVSSLLQTRQSNQRVMSETLSELHAVSATEPWTYYGGREQGVTNPEVFLFRQNCVAD